MKTKKTEEKSEDERFQPFYETQSRWRSGNWLKREEDAITYMTFKVKVLMKNKLITIIESLRS